MHANPAFRAVPTEASLAYARARGFGALCVNAPDGPLVSHVPFDLSEDGAQAELHLVRSNPILRLIETPQPAVLVVSGPDGYVSPDWYGVEDQVPTWNYVAVHLRGMLELVERDALRDQLDGLSAAFETRFADKAPWTSDKMGAGVMERMMRAIAPCRLRIADVQATWKLNQNKPEGVRLAAADAVERSGVGQELAALARLMRAGDPTD
jgi:transcriptional regulator